VGSGPGRGRSGSPRNREVSNRDFRQWFGSSRVDSPPHAGNNGRFASAFEPKREREYLPLHQIGSQAVQGEVTLSRLKGDRRYCWYDNSFWERGGFSQTVDEEGAAYSDASRRRSPGAQ